MVYTPFLDYFEIGCTIIYMLVLFAEWLGRRPFWLVLPLWILIVMPWGITERVLQNIIHEFLPKKG